MSASERVGTVRGPIEGRRPPFGAPKVDLDALGYVLEEYFLEGETVAYELTDKPTVDGRWEAVEAGVAAYRTRLLVIRPSSPERFNGTVLLNWNNVSAGFEGPAPSSGEAYAGYAWVGVSAQEIGLYGLPAGMEGRVGRYRVPPLVDHDPERYRTLLHPGDQGAYEMFTQAARAVGPDRGGDGVDPLGRLLVRHVVATGGSQSAMRLVAYANAIHPLVRVVDGFLLTVWEARAPRPEEGPISFGGYRTMVRDDLGVPVLVVNSEFEAHNRSALPIRDTETFRLWEVTGTPHGNDRGRPQDDRVDEQGRTVNRLSARPVHEAAMHRRAASRLGNRGC